MSLGRNWFRYCDGVQSLASSEFAVASPQLTSPKRAGNYDTLANWHTEHGGMVCSDAYRFLLGKIAGSAEDNNDGVVLELDGTAKPSASASAHAVRIHRLVAGHLLECCCQ
jgi:hypothetical protein